MVTLQQMRTWAREFLNGAPPLRNTALLGDMNGVISDMELQNLRVRNARRVKEAIAQMGHHYCLFSPNLKGSSE